MTRARGVTVSLLGMVVMGVVAVFLWPQPGYDISRVHSSLRELATPYQSVFTTEYLDGGSIGITVVDRNGRRLQLALPVSSENGRTCFRRLFVGATHTTQSGAVEVPFSEDTRRMLLSIIEQNRSPTGLDDIALISLRGAPRDWARFWGRMAVSWCGRLAGSPPVSMND